MSPSVLLHGAVLLLSLGAAMPVRASSPAPSQHGAARHAGARQATAEPLACVLDAIPANLRARHAELLARIDLPSRHPVERAEGWAFALGHDTALLSAVAEWIPLESKCCPFIGFEITWDAKAGGTLLLRGSPEARHLIGAMLAP